MVTPGWEKRLKAASFRGVPFGVFDYDTQGGRRVALHEYPFRDDNYPEDMGLATDGYQINAFVIGDDHDIMADALEVAIRKKGAGTLVHPRHGTIEVQLQTYSRSESNSAGGMTKFGLNFIKANKPRYPASGQNVQSLALSLLNRIRTSLLFHTFERVTELYNRLRDGSWLIKQISPVATMIEPLFSLRSAISGNFGGNPPSLPGFLFDTTTLLQSLAILPGAPADAQSGGWLAQSATLDAATLPAQMTRATQAASVLLQALPTTPGAILPASQYLLHIAATLELVTQVATTTTVINYDSYDDAVKARDTAHALLDAAYPFLSVVTATENHATIYDDWRELRTLIATAIQQQALLLPKIAHASVAAPKPALLLAYQIHTDAQQANDLIARNRIPHPLFVAGNLEYLSHA